MKLLTVGSVRKVSRGLTLDVPCVMKKNCLNNTTKSLKCSIYASMTSLFIKKTEPNGFSFVQKRKTHVKFIYSMCIFEACLKVVRSYN